MPHFAKRPIVIEAVPAREALHAAAQDWSALPEWLKEAYEAGEIVFAADGVHIRTLEGVMRADPDDWIISGVKGEIYPCKPDVFAATYERIDP